jgi:hypothetical protein
MHRFSYRALPLLLSLMLLTMMGILKPDRARAFAADTTPKEYAESPEPNLRVSETLIFGGMDLRVFSDCSDGLCAPKHSIEWGNGDTLELTAEQLSDPIEHIAVCDLDQDGNLELALTTTSCGSGSHGDFLLLERADGKWTAHRLCDSPESIQSGCWGHEAITVWDDHVEVSFPVYADDDSNSCPTAGKRSLSYTFDGDSFKLSSYREGPPSQSMSGEG